MENLRSRITRFLETYRKSPTWLADRAGVGVYSVTRYLADSKTDMVHGNWVKLQQAMDDYERIILAPNNKDAA